MAHFFIITTAQKFIIIQRTFHLPLQLVIFNELELANVVRTSKMAFFAGL